MKNILLLAIITLSLSSCSQLTYFTSDIYERYSWTEQELQSIQFYLSDEIVLQRRLSKGTKEIIDGDVKIVNGERVEIIKIPKGTPGVIEFLPDKERIAVKFEEGSEKYLMFGANPKLDDRYMLLATEWKRHSGIVHYNGKKYRTQSNSQLAALMIDLKKVTDRDVKVRTAKGVRVGTDN
jgi:hypothetical protein